MIEKISNKLDFQYYDDGDYGVHMTSGNPATGNFSYISIYIGRLNFE